MQSAGKDEPVLDSNTLAKVLCLREKQPFCVIRLASSQLPGKASQRRRRVG